MGIKKNPFEVGYSSDDAWTVVRARCTCCALMFDHRFNTSVPKTAAVCEQCVDHVPIDGQSDERRAVRAESHEARLRASLITLGEQAAGHRKERDGALERMRSALRSRDRYRRRLSGVEDLHSETVTGCSCKTKDCRVLKVLSAADNDW